MEKKVINDPERFMSSEYVEHGKPIEESERFRYLVNLINNEIKKEGVKILDVGGASGVFLDKLMKESKYKMIAYNLDFDVYYKDKQVNKDIKFLNASIIDTKIKEEQFDIVTFRHMLHHLVGKSVKETKRNQEKAVQEMFRILKKGGYLIFEEEVNNVKLFSRIVYYLSKFANKLGIKSKSFQAGDVVVSFLTQRELRGMIERVGKMNENRLENVNDKIINNDEEGVGGDVERSKISSIEIIQSKYVPWKMGLRWKMTLLMGWVGHVFGVGRKK